jgi:hypothetical protein
MSIADLFVIPPWRKKTNYGSYRISLQLINGQMQFGKYPIGNDYHALRGLVTVDLNRPLLSLAPAI